jgi:UDP-N-acetylglucosamine 3-dehydrogenase
LERVKFAVIGLGWFGQKHCEVLSDLSHVELYALCTRNESRLKELGECFHVKHLYTDYHQLLNNDEIDAVSVVTMWDQHLQPTLASLEAGKHVFLEKPMASTVADAEKMVAATKKTSKFFMVGHICRFNPDVKRLVNKYQQYRFLSLQVDEEMKKSEELYIFLENSGLFRVLLQKRQLH